MNLTAPFLLDTYNQKNRIVQRASTITFQIGCNSFLLLRFSFVFMVSPPFHFILTIERVIEAILFAVLFAKS